MIAIMPGIRRRTPYWSKNGFSRTNEVRGHNFWSILKCFFLNTLNKIPHLSLEVLFKFSFCVKHFVNILHKKFQCFFNKCLI